MRVPVPQTLAIAALLALAACQSPDVGQPCSLTWGDADTTPPPSPVELHTSGGADYFESGNLGCENLVCIVSPSPAGSRYASGGYCSKPCVSNQDCFQSETGLVCRQMVLDAAFIAELPADVRDRYVPDVQASSYCAVER
jgi:hypothetical protein